VKKPIFRVIRGGGADYHDPASIGRKMTLETEDGDMDFSRKVIRAYGVVERIIIYILLAMLTLVVSFAMVTFAAEIFRRLWLRLSGAPPDPASASEFLHQFAIYREVFGTFLLILIGVELIKTIVTYLQSHELHIEVVFTVAMIAIARHAIDVDIEKVSPMTIIGMGAMVLALALSYYYFRKATADRRPRDDST
jgi:uncharacterized membrane protein (DUF373 family)